MKSLIVDDDFSCRKILTKYLAPLGECDVAVNGSEALSAFEEALNNNSPYDLICLDIMMPGIDGNQTLAELRKRENQKGILGLDGVRIIMVTGIDDKHSIMGAFRGGCEAYIVKPLDKTKLFEKLSELRLKLNLL